MFTVSFTAVTLADLKVQLQNALSQFETKLDQGPISNIMLPSDAAGKVSETPKVSKYVKAQKPVKPLEMPPPSKEEALKALQTFNIKKGLAAARELLKEFNCARISEVKEEQYPDFIRVCYERADA